MNTTPAPLTAERLNEIRTNLFRSEYARDTAEQTAACYEADVADLLAELARLRALPA